MQSHHYPFFITGFDASVVRATNRTITTEDRPSSRLLRGLLSDLSCAGHFPSVDVCRLRNLESGPWLQTLPGRILPALQLYDMVTNLTCIMKCVEGALTIPSPIRQTWGCPTPTGDQENRGDSPEAQVKPKTICLMLEEWIRLGRKGNESISDIDASSVGGFRSGRRTTSSWLKNLYGRLASVRFIHRPGCSVIR